MPVSLGKRFEASLFITGVRYNQNVRETALCGSVKSITAIVRMCSHVYKSII